MKLGILLVGVIFLFVCCSSFVEFVKGKRADSNPAIDSVPSSSGWFLLVFVGCLTLFLAGCATSGVTIDTDKSHNRSKAYSKALAPFAAMSALAYELDPIDGDETRTTRMEIEKFLTEGTNAWEKLTEFSPGPAAKAVGLAYEVWINHHLSPKVVVIAVRGTEFTQWQDWKSNLWWLTRFFSKKNQYRVAPSKEEVGRVFAQFKSEPKTIFITTGHSLGGGVAQGLMYAFPEVSQCYAFNPSPVTSFYDQTETNQLAYSEKLPLPGFPSHRTLRVYEKGEVLAYLRAQMRTMYPLDDKIMEVRWEFDPKHNTISKHGMLRLAQNIVSVHQDNKISDPEPEYRPWWFRPPSSSALAPNPKKIR